MYLSFLNTYQRIFGSFFHLFSILGSFFYYYFLFFQLPYLIYVFYLLYFDFNRETFLIKLIRGPLYVVPFSLFFNILRSYLFLCSNLWGLFILI